MSELVNQSRAFPVPLCRKRGPSADHFTFAMSHLKQSQRDTNSDTTIKVDYNKKEKRKKIATKFHRLQLPFYVPGFLIFKVTSANRTSLIIITSVIS